jgi:hypothetical protein
MLTYVVCRRGISSVLLSDARDVIFQADPFLLLHFPRQPHPTAELLTEVGEGRILTYSHLSSPILTYTCAC